MKKYISICTILVAMLLVASAAMAGKGAVKMDLLETLPSSGRDVGGVNFNINANNQLIITAHINRGEPGLTLDIIGLFMAEISSVIILPFNLALDEEGGGSAQIIWDLPPELTSLDAINLGVTMTGSAFFPQYSSAVLTSVPLKK